jgi:hypothetical protein
MRLYSTLEFGGVSRSDSGRPVDDEEARARARMMEEWLDMIRHCLFPGYPITILVAAVLFNAILMHVCTSRSSSSSTGKDSASHINGVATVAVLLTYIWTAILRVFESNDLRNNSQAGFFPLMLLQPLSYQASDYSI